MGQIDRQAVAGVDTRVELELGVQGKGFLDPRLKIEVPAKDAAAERSCNHNQVARPRPARRNGPRGVSEPRAVTLTTNGPSQLLVSPPAIATP